MSPIKSLVTPIVAAVLVVLAGCVTADKGSAKPSNAMLAPISAAEYERHISTLSSDEFEGRKPGTAGERKTVDYLINEFKKLGLKPGNGSSWLQEVPIVEITAGSDAGIDVVSSEYATVAAESTALENLSSTVADQIIARLAQQARSQPGQ